jgi:pimeloyl-ACP methyl ester carboxylesterase
LTNIGASSSRSYWEGAQAGGGPFNAVDIPTVPVAVIVFPAEICRAPRRWGEQTFGNIIYCNEVDKGGHFAAWEQPQIFAKEIHAAFRSLGRARWLGRRERAPSQTDDVAIGDVALVGA